MKSHLKLNQAGFHVLFLLVALLVIGIIGASGYVVYQKSQSKEKSGATLTTAPEPGDPNAPPLKIKHIGITLKDFDPATNTMGDLVFTKDGLASYGNLLIFDYGAVAEANSAAQRRLNPQPTFIIPLGTKIHSLVDGVVVNVPKLYSNDYSIQVGVDKESQWLYETEHVINPTVKVGDTVKAGQVIAEASTHDSQYHPGFGLYEIGILHAGTTGPPQHVCPFKYLDDSIKQDIYSKLTNYYAAWEAYQGNNTLYDESKHVVPGCYTLDPIEG